MVNDRCCRLLAGLAVLAATLVLASPAQAAVSASYGTATPVMPTVGACTGGTCMSTSASFASNGSVSTNVTVTVTLYRTAKAGATATSTSDYVVKKASVTYATAKTAKSTWTLAASQKCRTVATATYGYYSRVTITNGTTAGTVSQNSAIKQLKGCVSV